MLLCSAPGIAQWKSETGSTALHSAARYGSVEGIVLLLDLHAEVNARDQEGRTPLFVACSSPRKEIEVVRLLLANGADPEIRDTEGKSVFDLIQEWDSATDTGLEIRKLLLGSTAAVAAPPETDNATDE